MNYVGTLSAALLYVHGDDTTHSEMGLPISIWNPYNPPIDVPTVQSDVGNALIEVFSSQETKIVSS